MFKTHSIFRKLLTTSMAILMSIAAASALAMDENQAAKIYVDPVTGEVVEYRKLLSEMTEEEKANLSLDEVKKLQEIEAAQKSKEKVREPGQ